MFSTLHDRTMCLVALLLSCLAYAETGRRWHRTDVQAQVLEGTALPSLEKSSGALARFFLSFNYPGIGSQSTLCNQAMSKTMSKHPGSDAARRGAKGVLMSQPESQSQSEFVPSMVRRRGLAALAAVAITQLPAKAFADTRTLIEDGMLDFRNGKVEESMVLYDQVIKERPSQKPSMWMRGVSLYYADRFKEGADQFATTWTVNPNDENRLWHLLCLARLEGFDTARKKRLPYGRERRPALRAAFRMFAGETDEAPLQAFTSSSDGYESYIANLYLGMYHEALGDENGARKYIASARNTYFGQWADNYMTDMARVHAKRRGW
mmetsp:Transcript_130131/g.236439  ORF Transcript_130131/g.236439 Transcript_130131/m.236439 type:complete len:322 (-) Transcript_130131:54-1019(-)